MRTLLRVSVTAIAVLVISCTTQGTSQDRAEPDKTSKDSADKAAASAAATQAAATAQAAGDTESAEHSCGGEGSCCGGAGHAPAEQAPVPEDAVWFTLKVSGMRCGNCANKIRATLADMEGVLGVEADHESGEVKIAAAPGAGDVRDKVAPRIDALGYEVLDI